MSRADVIIIDDLIDTGGTLVNSAELCLLRGARSARAVATHAVLSGDAQKRLASEALQSVAFTNTLQRDPETLLKKCEILDVAPLLGEAIRRIHNAESVSSLFI